MYMMYVYEFYISVKRRRKIWGEKEKYLRTGQVDGQESKAL